ncbi:hypothetical protein GCM10022197_38570 [Microlunatus spumicola]|uniref:DUF4126 domain-containing protein n=1 Tax=Microlunatus spumicola TaxID=81499 RepID=A0ABP6Y581_9ACTN
MTLQLPTVARAALLGLATGSRSFTGLAAQVLATPSLATRQPEQALGRLRVKGLVGLLAAGELVGDKLPAVPSRLAPPVLASRLGLAALTALLASRAADVDGRARRGPTAYEQGPAEASQPPEVRAPVVPTTAYVAVPVAVVASLASAFLGHAWRGWASKAFGRDWPGAVAEDAAALALAAVATR